MRRGTTALNVFITNKDLRDARVYVTYSQIGRNIIEKTNDDIIISETNIQVPLEQEDTLRMSTKYPLFIQIRYVKEDGVANASNIIKVSVEDVLKGGVINYE